MDNETMDNETTTHKMEDLLDLPFNIDLIEHDLAEKKTLPSIGLTVLSFQ